MDAPPSRCGVLLAGGASSRFGGSPKGLASCGAVRLADHPLQALAAVCERVVIASNAPDAASWFPGHDVERDAMPGLGALSALDTALRAGHGAVVLVCAWDMPFVTADLLEALAQVVESGERCCVPQQPDGRLEPLCAAYAADCAGDATALLAAGERAAQALARAVGGARWAVPAPLQERRAPNQFFNVNTAADLAYASTWITRHPTAT